MQRICVIGLGYIGLPTAAMFAENGYKVLGVDVNKHVINTINNGQIHIEEPGLSELVKKVVGSGNLSASSEPDTADVFIIAVPTPQNINHSANLDYVKSATESILPKLIKGNVVIIESTIPPRTIDDFVAPILNEAGFRVGEDIFLAHCPERVLPGKILKELVENTRIVGGYNEVSAQEAAKVYRTFVKGEILETIATTAEMAKLMENTYRDVNIALANELAKISDRLGINALDVIKLANHHPRVNIHQPGPGVGGHCIAVDPYFIIEKAPLEAKLITKARSINNSMPQFVVEQIKKIIPISNGKISIFGITYKGNVDDVRESPAFEIIELLESEGYTLSIYDPHVKQEQVDFTLSNFKEAINNSHCILVLTDHNEFRSMNEEQIIESMSSPVIFDTKNCAEIKNERICYYNYGNLFEINSTHKASV